MMAGIFSVGKRDRSSFVGERKGVGLGVGRWALRESERKNDSESLAHLTSLASWRVFRFIALPRLPIFRRRFLIGAISFTEVQFYTSELASNPAMLLGLCKQAPH